MKEMEAARLSKKADGLLRAFDSFSEGIMVCDSSTPQLEILFLNDVWCKMTGKLLRPDADNGFRLPEAPMSLASPTSTRTCGFGRIQALCSSYWKRIQTSLAYGFW